MIYLFASFRRLALYSTATICDVPHIFFQTESRPVKAIIATANVRSTCTFAFTVSCTAVGFSHARKILTAHVVKGGSSAFFTVSFAIVCTILPFTTGDIVNKDANSSYE